MEYQKNLKKAYKEDYPDVAKWLNDSTRSFRYVTEKQLEDRNARQQKVLNHYMQLREHSYRFIAEERRVRRKEKVIERRLKQKRHDDFQRIWDKQERDIAWKKRRRKSTIQNECDRVAERVKKFRDQRAECLGDLDDEDFESSVDARSLILSTMDLLTGVSVEERDTQTPETRVSFGREQKASVTSEESASSSEKDEHPYDEFADDVNVGSRSPLEDTEMRFPDSNETAIYESEEERDSLAEKLETFPKLAPGFDSQSTEAMFQKLSLVIENHLRTAVDVDLEASNSGASSDDLPPKSELPGEELLEKRKLACFIENILNCVKIVLEKSKSSHTVLQYRKILRSHFNAARAELIKIGCTGVAIAKFDGVKDFISTLISLRWMLNIAIKTICENRSFLDANVKKLRYALSDIDMRIDDHKKAKLEALEKVTREERHKKRMLEQKILKVAEDKRSALKKLTDSSLPIKEAEVVKDSTEKETTFKRRITDKQKSKEKQKKKTVGESILKRKLKKSFDATPGPSLESADLEKSVKKEDIEEISESQLAELSISSTDDETDRINIEESKYKIEKENSKLTCMPEEDLPLMPEEELDIRNFDEESGKSSQGTEPSGLEKSIKKEAVDAMSESLLDELPLASINEEVDYVNIGEPEYEIEREDSRLTDLPAEDLLPMIEEESDIRNFDEESAKKSQSTEPSETAIFTGETLGRASSHQLLEKSVEDGTLSDVVDKLKTVFIESLERTSISLKTPSEESLTKSSEDKTVTAILDKLKNEIVENLDRASADLKTSDERRMKEAASCSTADIAEGVLSEHLAKEKEKDIEVMCDMLDQVAIEGEEEIRAGSSEKVAEGKSSEKDEEEQVLHDERSRDVLEIPKSSVSDEVDSIKEVVGGVTQKEYLETRSEIEECDKTNETDKKTNLFLQNEEAVVIDELRSAEDLKKTKNEQSQSLSQEDELSRENTCTDFESKETENTGTKAQEYFGKSLTSREQSPVGMSNSNIEDNDQTGKNSAFEKSNSENEKLEKLIGEIGEDWIQKKLLDKVDDVLTHCVPYVLENKDDKGSKISIDASDDKLIPEDQKDSTVDVEIDNLEEKKLSSKEELEIEPEWKAAEILADENISTARDTFNNFSGNSATDNDHLTTNALSDVEGTDRDDRQTSDVRQRLDGSRTFHFVQGTVANTSENWVSLDRLEIPAMPPGIVTSDEGNSEYQSSDSKKNAIASNDEKIAEEEESSGPDKDKNQKNEYITNFCTVTYNTPYANLNSSNFFKNGSRKETDVKCHKCGFISKKLLEERNGGWLLKTHSMKNAGDLLDLQYREMKLKLFLKKKKVKPLIERDKHDEYAKIMSNDLHKSSPYIPTNLSQQDRQNLKRWVYEKCKNFGFISGKEIGFGKINDFKTKYLLALQEKMKSIKEIVLNKKLGKTLEDRFESWKSHRPAVDRTNDLRESLSTENVPHLSSSDADEGMNNSNEVLLLHETTTIPTTSEASVTRTFQIKPTTVDGDYEITCDGEVTLTITPSSTKKSDVIKRVDSDGKFPKEQDNPNIINLSSTSSKFLTDDNFSSDDAEYEDADSTFRSSDHDFVPRLSKSDISEREKAESENIVLDEDKGETSTSTHEIARSDQYADLLLSSIASKVEWIQPGEIFLHECYIGGPIGEWQTFAICNNEMIDVCDIVCYPGKISMYMEEFVEKEMLLFQDDEIEQSKIQFMSHESLSTLRERLRSPLLAVKATVTQKTDMRRRRISFRDLFADEYADETAEVLEQMDATEVFDVHSADFAESPEIDDIVIEFIPDGLDDEKSNSCHYEQPKDLDLEQLGVEKSEVEKSSEIIKENREAVDADKLKKQRTTITSMWQKAFTSILVMNRIFPEYAEPNQFTVVDCETMNPSVMTVAGNRDSISVSTYLSGDLLEKCIIDTSHLKAFKEKRISENPLQKVEEISKWVRKSISIEEPSPEGRKDDGKLRLEHCSSPVSSQRRSLTIADSINLEFQTKPDIDDDPEQ